MASTDTDVDIGKDGLPAAGGFRDPHDLTRLEAGLDALDSVQTGRTPLRETLIRKVLPPVTAVALLLVGLATAGVGKVRPRLLSIAVVFFVGTIELVGVLHDKLGLRDDVTAWRGPLARIQRRAPHAKGGARRQRAPRAQEYGKARRPVNRHPVASNRGTPARSSRNITRPGFPRSGSVCRPARSGGP